jgi:hypothetical protein
MVRSLTVEIRVEIIQLYVKTDLWNVAVSNQCRSVIVNRYSC